MKKPIDVDTANFIQFSMTKGIKVREILSNPEAISNRLGVSLKDSELQQLRDLNAIPERIELSNISCDAKEFVTEVLRDGRFVLDWKDNPQEVSNRLGLSLNPEVINELDDIDLSDYLDPNVNPEAGIKIAIITIAIAVVLGSAEIGDDQFPVLDLSKVEKL